MANTNKKNPPADPKDLEAALKRIAQLEEENATLRKTSAAAGALPVVKHGGKTYQFTAKKFQLNTPDGFKIVTAEEAAEDEELVKMIIKDGIGVLSQITD